MQSNIRLRYGLTTSRPYRFRTMAMSHNFCFYVWQHLVLLWRAAWFFGSLIFLRKVNKWLI
jgi:hypothetical protein